MANFKFPIIRPSNIPGLTRFRPSGAASEIFETIYFNKSIAPVYKGAKTRNTKYFGIKSNSVIYLGTRTLFP